MKKAEKKKISRLSRKLKDFRDDFIRGAIVSGSCRTESIPYKYRPKDKKLPDNFEGQLVVCFGDEYHYFTFSAMDRKQDVPPWRIENTGLENYKAMLDDIWDASTGLQYRYPEDDMPAVWLVRTPEHVDLLNKKADLICELSEPILKIVAKVRKTVRPDGHPWTTKSTVEWSYLDKLEEIIKELDSTVAGAQKPAETEQNTTPAKIINIGNFKGILGDVQAENVQTGNHASIHKQTVTTEKKKGILKKLLKWLVGVIGAIVVGIIVTVVTDILGDFGWIERIKRLFTR